MNRLLHLVASVFMLLAIINSLFTCGPVIEAASYSLEHKRNSNVLCQEHFLETPNLPFLFTNDNNSSVLGHSNPRSPLNCFIASSERLKNNAFRTINSGFVKPPLGKRDVPIYIRVRSLRN